MIQSYNKNLNFNIVMGALDNQKRRKEKLDKHKDERIPGRKEERISRQEDQERRRREEEARYQEKDNGKSDYQFHDRGDGVTVEVTSKGTTKNFGKSKESRRQAEEQLKNAQELKKRMPNTIVPELSRDKYGNYVLISPTMTDLKSSGLSEREKDRITAKLLKDLEKAGYSVSDARNNILLDENGNPYIHDLTHLRKAPESAARDNEYKQYKRDIEKSLSTLETLEKQREEKANRRFLSRDTTELDILIEAEKEKLRNSKNSQSLREEELRKEEEEKKGTWIFTAVLEKNFPKIFESFGSAEVKDLLVKQLYPINMLVISTNIENNTLFGKLLKNIFTDKNLVPKYKEMRGKYLDLYTKKRADLASSMPVFKDEVLVGLMSIFAAIDDQNPRYFSQPLKQMIQEYKDSNKSLRYYSNFVKILNTNPDNKYLKKIVNTQSN
ncbi:MAG: hypothetical protein ACRCXZ_01685 [Patescibacteria group bacterium]